MPEPLTFLDELRRRAGRRRRRVVFPEGEDPRIREAALAAAAARLADPVLLGPAGELKRHLANDPRARKVRVVDPADPRRIERHVAVLRQLERFADLGEPELRRRASDPLHHGALMVRTGEADGGVAGAAHATAAVIRAGIRCVGPAPGITTVSSSFLMVVPPFRGPETEVLTFADSAIVPDPTAEQLAEIAGASCRARRRIVGDEPRVAFLSYSTRGSAEGPSVDKVRRALARFRDLSPGIPADGELQADAALIEAVSRRKLPDSPVAGTANVLIFPDLDAGNIAYKLVQRLAGAEALGPVVQGLEGAWCDLSRGATVDDAVHVACITSLLAD